MNAIHQKRDLYAKRSLWVLGIVFVFLVIVVLIITSMFSGNAAKNASASAAKATPTASAEALPTTGVQETDDSYRQLPLYNGTDETVVFDSTTDPVTPRLLDGSLKYQNQTHSWAELVERVGDQSWYIDGVNARAAYTGFNWSDVLKFAAVDKTDTDLETRVIQVFNLPVPSSTEEAAQQEADIRKDVSTYMGDVANSLQIIHINTNFVNTINVGTKQNQKMGDYVDGQKMIRVSLMPIIFDANGTAIQLDATKGAGIFIDCGNLHWVPKQVYECTDSSCTPPTPVTPPTTTPPVETPPTTTTPPTSNAKNAADSVGAIQGMTQQSAGQQTTSQVSEDQQASGAVKGNVTDNSVSSGTTTGTTTTDTGAGVPVTGASPAAADAGADDTVDDSVTNHNSGGTTGDTHIAVPAD